MTVNNIENQCFSADSSFPARAPRLEGGVKLGAILKIQFSQHMSCFNLNINRLSCKNCRARFALLAGAFLALVLMIPGCTEDTTSGLPKNFTYDGTYVIREVSATRDGVVILAWDQNAAIGLLEIEGEIYHLQLSFSSNAFGEGSRSDQGILVFEDYSILFMSDFAGSNTIPRGVFDIEKDWLRINYLSSEFLWTEIWKRVVPVDES